MTRSFRDDGGRVHLELHRDPATGRESVTVTTPLYDEQWLNETVAGSASTVLGVLGQEPTPEGVTEAARRLMALTSQLVARLLALAPEGAVACQSGCDHCCHQIVGVSAPEALAIFEHLQSTRSAAELERLKAHVAMLHERSCGLSSAERISPAQPCVFLDGGRCSIYDVRPFACRGVNSLDAVDCERRLKDPEARAVFLAKGHGGRCYVAPLHAFRAVSAGLQLALTELYRLDPRGLDLTAAMHVLLQGDATTATRWLGGEQPFAAALRESETQSR
jgi:Fe-S-cluster containining protein